MSTTRRETARGFSVSQNTSGTLTNTNVETTMFTQTMAAGSMGINKEVFFRFICLLTTGLLPPTITIKVKLGSSVLTVVSTTALSASMTSVPFIVEGSVINQDTTGSQLAWARLTQPSNTLALLLSGGTAMAATDWTEDTTADKNFVITAQFGSSVSSTTLTFRHASIDLT